MKNYIKIVKKRLIAEPITSVFLILGLAMAMLLTSMETSFVSQIIKASKLKESNSPKNAYNIFVENNSEIEIDTLEVFSNLTNKTGVILNGIVMHVDKQKANIYNPVSMEWFKNDDVWHYPLSEGRYYTSKEIEAGKHVVLIGKSLKDYVDNIKGKDCIVIEGEEYEVIGIVGVTGETTAWDTRIFMPYTCKPKRYIEEYNENNFSCILYNTKDVISENIQKIKDVYNNKNIDCSINIIGKIETDNAIEQVMQSPNEMMLIAIIGYIVSILYSINIVSLWMEKRQYEIGVRKAIGYSNKEVAKMIFAEMIGMAILSFLLVLIVQTLLGVFVSNFLFYTFRIYLSNIVVGILMVIITAVLTSICPIIKAFKIQPSEAVK